MTSERKQVTRMLQTLCDGNDNVSADLFPIVYEQLHAIAQSLLRVERSDHTLQATALVNEAYLRLVDVDAVDLDESSARQHFVSLAARAMRRILIDHARKRDSDKRGGGAQRVTLDDSMKLAEHTTISVLDLDQALETLERVDPRLVQAAELRLFGGLSVAEMAPCMGLSLTRAKVVWTSARVTLQKLLAD